MFPRGLLTVVLALLTALAPACPGLALGVCAGREAAGAAETLGCCGAGCPCCAERQACGCAAGAPVRPSSPAPAPLPAADRGAAIDAALLPPAVLGVAVAAPSRRWPAAVCGAAPPVLIERGEPQAALCVWRT